MSDRDRLISEIGASLIRDISCQSCADLRAELEVLQERADSAAADRDGLMAAVYDREIERDEARAAVWSMKAIVAGFRKHHDNRLRAAHHASCTCGGAGPGEGCAACDMWHAMQDKLARPGDGAAEE